jgi:hypothetical protein
MRSDALLQRELINGELTLPLLTESFGPAQRTLRAGRRTPVDTPAAKRYLH